MVDADSDGVLLPGNEALAETVAQQLLVRWGIVAWEIWSRESFKVPWREVVWALRRLEARGLVLGGRFVAGLSGEQYALPEAFDGLQATREIRIREGRGRHIPIIAMTAGAMLGDQETCLAAGMDDYVSKPYVAAALLDTVARWLGVGTDPDPGPGADPGDPVDDETPPVLDTGHLDILEKMMTPAQLGAILRTCLEGDAVRLAKIEDLGRAGDLGRLGHEAHSLKGVYGNLGARRIQHLAETLERAALDGDLPRVQAIVGRMPAVFCETRTMMRARLATLNSMADSEGMGPCS